MMEDFSVEVRVTVHTKTGPIILTARHFADSTINYIMDDVEEFLIMKGEKNDSTNSD